jgi:hypothetical protein
MATWVCPCGKVYRLRAVLGRPVFSTHRGRWEIDVTACVRCRRVLRKARAEDQAGRQLELLLEQAS